MHWIRLAALFVIVSTAESHAQVVAFGPSGTAGFGVSASEAYPARLEEILRNRGVKVTVSNQGVNGDTTDAMLARLDSAVPDGTRVVIFQPSHKDQMRGLMDVHARNVSEIISRLRARRIAVVFLDDQKMKDAGIARQAGAILCGIFSQNVPREDIIESGGQKGRNSDTHPDARGYEIIAERVAPCVVRALSVKG